MANDINSAELCLNAVQSLEEQLRGARKSLINNDTCVVNRSIMSARLEYLRDNLPKTVEIAAKIVAEEETIRAETEQKRNEIIESATAQAQNMINESTQKSRIMMDQASQDASALMDRANQEAAACMEAAKAEAQRIIMEAEKRRRNLSKKKISFAGQGLKVKNSVKTPKQMQQIFIKIHWIILILFWQKQTEK